MNRSLFILLTVFLLLPLAAMAQAVNDPPAEWSGSISLELLAPREKRTGEGWDFGPLTGGVVVPGPAGTGGFSHGVGSTYPDMWLIVIDAEGRAVAYLTRRGQRKPEGNLLTAIFRPATVASMARCPDSLLCTYRDIRVPSDAFGVVVLDQDISEYDFMTAGVLFTPGKTTDTTVRQIEQHVSAYLETLRAKGALSGAPAPDEPLPVRAISRCREKVCFADDAGGLAGVRVMVADVADFEGIACSVNPVQGRLTVQAIPNRRTAFELEVAELTCSGTVEYAWDFGDGTTVQTNTPKAMHSYAAADTYTVTMTPLCISDRRGCTGEPLRVEVEAK